MNRLHALRIAAACTLLAAGCHRRAATTAAPAARPATGKLAPGRASLSTPFDLRAVMKQVHFAFRKDGASFTGGDATFAVNVDPSGAWTIAPRSFPDGRPVGSRPAPALQTHATPQLPKLEKSIAGAPLALGPARILIGAAAIKMSSASVANDGHLQRAGSGVTEHLRNTETGVEQSWQLTHRPAGPVEIEIPASGLSFTGQTRSGLHFKDPKTGLGIRYGNATWVDARGKKTAVKAQYVRGAIRFELASALLRDATFPATLDPTVGPEFGMDDPVNGPESGTAVSPKVAFGGGEYLVVWEDRRNTSSYDIYGARVSTAGAILDPTGIAISTAANDQISPAVASDGTNFLVAWQDDRSNSNYDVYGARVSTAGAVLDPSGIAISTRTTGQGEPAIAYDGTHYLVVWQDTRFGAQIFGARLSTAGVVLDPSGFAISNSTGDRYAPAVAFDGTNYLVVWQDARNGSSNYDIYGARVSAAGSVLDASGIAISTATGNQQAPSVAFSGTNYLVVWQDGRSGQAIYGTRVSTAGAVLDDASTGIAICTLTDSQYEPAVAFDGTNYLVAWEDLHNTTTTNFDIYGSRVSTAGSVLDPSGIVISAGGTEGSPAVAFDGTHYLVVWGHGAGTADDIYGARVSTDGSVLDTSAIVVSTSANAQQSPAVAFDGTNYLVVWQDARQGPLNEDIYGARVSAAGSVLDTSGIAISTATGNQTAPAIAFDGTNYLVVWQDARNGSSSDDIYGARVSTDGSVLDASGVAISTATGYQTVPALGFDGTNYVVVWQDTRNGSSNDDIYGARVSTDGSVLDTSGVAISTATGNQTVPAIASNGTHSLVVWQDTRSGVDDIYGALVSSSSGLTTSEIAISTALNDQTAPAVTFDGTYYFVAWQDYRSGSSADIYGARVSTAGVVRDSQGITISNATGDQTVPSVAFDGTYDVVVWQDTRSGNDDIYAARVSNSIAFPVDSSGIAIATSSDSEVTPRVVSGGAGISLIAYARLDSSSTYGLAPRARGRFFYEMGLGDSCTSASQCPSGFCVDGVCCDSACGGGSTTDCQACSRSAGAATDGTCGPVADNTACDDGNACTSSDVCTGGTCGGTAKSCDDGNPCTTDSCDASTGACSSTEVADGTSCGSGEVCASGACTAECFIGGALVGSGVVNPDNACQSCQPAVSTTSWSNVGDGTRCDDGDACTRTDTCTAGVCTGGDPVTCTASDQCHVAGSCDPATGVCGNPPAADGTTCNDGNPCTQTDTCSAGICLGSNPVTCTAADQCHTAGTCDPATGACSNPTAPDGTPCDDGDACTQTDACSAGVCLGSNPVTCTAADQCHTVGSCDPATGQCSNPAVVDGTGCDDGNPCTTGEACFGGICDGGAPVVYDAGVQCYAASCNLQDGGEILTALDGTQCDDGRACTGPDICRAGVCTPDTNSCTCTVDSDCAAPAQCQASVRCDADAGVCVYANQPDGTACNDGNACTRTDTCQGGVCIGANPVVCVASDACHLAGTCNPDDGGCTDPVAPEDAGCDDGRTCTTGDHCSAGVCVGDATGCGCSSAADCPAPSQCQASVSCDVSSGTCTYVDRPDDAGCDDGNACTTGEHCVSGVCGSPGATVTCTALDSCHVPGVCDPSTGVCSNPLADAGTPCDDGRACTVNDACQDGLCVGDASGCGCTTNADCAPLDECHTAGSCDLDAGTCTHPAKADGALCTGGSCMGGACVPSGSSSGSSGSTGSSSGSGSGTSGAPPDKFNLGATGCGCSSSGGFDLAWLGILVAFGMRRRRRG